MKTTGIFLGLAGILVVLGIWVMGAYNTLITLEEGVDNSYAKIETQYQRRFDLVPNLVSSVQGAADFEQETLTAVTEARTQWQGAGSVNERIEAANGFESALARLLVTVEAYPTLTATQGFRDLQVQLEGTENRIAFARNEYNDTATIYNTAVRRFPSNLLASTLGFPPERELFVAAEGANVAPVVEFQ